MRVVSERVVGGDEVPLLAVFEQRRADGVREHRVRAGGAERHAVAPWPRDVRVVRSDGEEEDAGSPRRSRRPRGRRPTRGSPSSTSTFSCAIRRLRFVGADRRLAGVVALDDLVLDARVLLVRLVDRELQPDCCDSIAAAYTPEKPSMWPILTVDAAAGRDHVGGRRERSGAARPRFEERKTEGCGAGDSERARCGGEIRGGSVEEKDDWKTC